MFKNTPSSYGFIHKLMHWLSAISVFGLFGLGWWMVDLTYYDAWYKSAPHYHKSIGILLFIVMVIRLLWRTYNPKVLSLTEHSRFEKRAAHIVHLMIYILFFLIAIMGYLISTADERGIDVFNWFQVPGFGSLFENQEDIAGNIHRWLAYTLIGLTSLHALAALKHHFIDKDLSLKRMI